MYAQAPKRAVDSTEFASDLAKCVTTPEQAYCLPPACYVDDSVLESEIESIFRQAWICIGRADQLKAAGDYDIRHIANVPIIILRDKQLNLRAFANSCRHRGTRLLDGKGNCSAIVCPFHSWTYQLDGRLIGATHMDQTLDFEKSANGLRSFATAERAGFAFICMADSPQDIDVHLGDLNHLHAPWGLESLLTTRRRSLQVNCNWKACLDVFNEYYHLKNVHPISFDGLYAMPGPAAVTSGAYASQFSNTMGSGGLLIEQQDQMFPAIASLEGNNKNGVRYTWIFPNMAFAAGEDSLWMYEAYPLGPHRCEVVQTVCFPAATLKLADFEQRAVHYYDRFDVAFDEDILALENQHQGLNSAFARAGRFSLPQEANVAAFAHWYAQQLL